MGSIAMYARERVCVVEKGGMQGLLSTGARRPRTPPEDYWKWHIWFDNVVSGQSFVNSPMRSLDKKGNTALCLCTIHAMPNGGRLVLHPI